MKKYILAAWQEQRPALAVLLMLGALVCASNAYAQKTPLIDREILFGDPEISGAQLSPDGRYISFVKPFKGTRNVWVKRAEEPFEKAKPVTASTTRPIGGYFWSRDSRFILYVMDKGGDENFNIYAVNPTEADSGEPAAARNLTDLKNVRAFIYNLPKSDPDVIYIGLNDRDPAWHDLYKVKISTGERTLLRKNTERVLGWTFDNRDQLRLAVRSADSGDTEIVAVSDTGFKKVYSCNIFETCTPIRFHKDDARVYIQTNRGDTDLVRLVLFDPASGKEEVVESDPKKRVDLSGVNFSEVSNELIATIYEDERTRVYFKNKKFEADYNYVKSKLGDKDLNIASSTADEMRWIVVATSDLEPGEAYLFDRKTRKLELQYRVRERLDRSHLSPMQAISYKSSDGLEIPAYLTLPKGIEAKNLPLIVFPHGGPWARDRWGYNSYAQFLSNRGYAVLQPNFRASTGYGKKFLNAGNGEWGQKMQDDITWGVKHLVGRGIVDPKRVGIMGGSYGGYATLAGLAFTPEVYAAGVSIVGPSNLITLLDSIPPYWEAIRKVFYVRMGDPNTPEGKAQLQRQSPLNSSEKIKSPLLVVQGANDPRVKRAESDQIVVALRERGFPVEYIVAPDEGHGFAKPVNNMAMLARAEQFLAKHLGGRFQEGATPEVAKRLQEITVDVKTVALLKKVDTASVGAPKPSSDLKAARVDYKAVISVGAQQIPMDISSEIREEAGQWVVSETAQTIMGAVADITRLEKGTLQVLSREVSQGPVKIRMEFKNGKATGRMAMNGQERPINVDLGGVLFADGAGAYLVLATLPLEDGFSTIFRNFDVQRARPTLKQLKVVGSESVTVPAGTFEAYKVEITSAEGDPGKATIWVSKDSRKHVKTVASLPQMQGAELTLELVK